ncbi:MAG: hydroxymethylbilane synthase [Acidimicrobiales bacterium]
MSLRIATRRSPLALWQTNHVVDLLGLARPDLEVEIVGLETTADQNLSVSISEIGGKGAFCKQVQQLVLDGRADIAVHSAKDLQAITPTGLMIGAFPERGDARDALVGSQLAQLRKGALVATGSQRRRVQLAEARPDLRFAELRGNIATRLGQLGTFDAIVMAVVALERLQIVSHQIDPLAAEVMLPQVGQGGLAIECRYDDPDVAGLLAAIDHRASRQLIEAERDFLTELGGDCDLPAGAHARFNAAEPGGDDPSITVVGMLATDTSSPVHRSAVSGLESDRPGRELARRLRASV